jgi:hypothetical protein
LHFFVAAARKTGVAICLDLPDLEPGKGKFNRSETPSSGGNMFRCVGVRLSKTIFLFLAQTCFAGLLG